MTSQASDNRSVYPPLTTLWTRPTSCQFTWAASESGHVTATLDRACYPPTPSSAIPATENVNRYSPGLCPNGFTTARTEDPSNSTITTAMCCTNGYAYSGVDTVCKRTVTTPTTIVSVGQAGQTSTIAVSSFTAHDQGVFVLFQTSDIDVIMSANVSYWLINPNSTSPGTPTSSLTLPDALAPTLPTTGDRPSGTNGLSTGAQAGIGIGIALGALILLGVVIWLWRRRRQGHARKGDAAGLIPGLSGDPATSQHQRQAEEMNQNVPEISNEMAATHAATAAQHGRAGV